MQSLSLSLLCAALLCLSVAVIMLRNFRMPANFQDRQRERDRLRKLVLEKRFNSTETENPASDDQVN